MKNTEQTIDLNSQCADGIDARCAPCWQNASDKGDSAQNNDGGSESDGVAWANLK